MISNITKHALFSIVIETGPVSRQLHEFLRSKQVNTTDITTIFDYIVSSLNNANFNSLARFALDGVFTSPYLHMRQDKQGNFILKQLIEQTQNEIWNRLNHLGATEHLGVDNKYVVTLGFYQEHQLMVCGLSNEDIDSLNMF